MPLKLTRRGRVWYVRGTVRGVRVYETTGAVDRSRAEEYRAAREAQLWDRRLHGERGQRPFAEAALVYLEGRALAPRSRAAIRPLVTHFGDWPLADIDQAALDAYARRYHPRAQPQTVQRAVITPMCAILRAAARRGWCASPAFERPKPPPARLRYLTEDEAERLIAASADHLRPLVVFLLYTGARLGEALRLDWRDVDLEARRVRFTRTKSGRPRGVPLHERAFLALANLPHREGAVFRTPAGAPYADRDGRGGGQIKTAWRGACIRAGLVETTGHRIDAKGRRRPILRPTVRVHDLRHTFASWLVMRGAPLRTVAELLGHASLDMVMRYAHLSPDHLRAAVDALPSGEESVQPREKAM